jgi:hypothetical protein
MTVTVLNKKFLVDNPFKGFGKAFWERLERWGEYRSRSVIREYWWMLDADTRASIIERWKKD